VVSVSSYTCPCRRERQVIASQQQRVVAVAPPAPPVAVRSVTGDTVTVSPERSGSDDRGLFNGMRVLVCPRCSGSIEPNRGACVLITLARCLAVIVLFGVHRCRLDQVAVWPAAQGNAPEWP